MSSDNSEQPMRLIGSFSFLLTFVLWMVSFWPEIAGIGDFLVSAVIAVIASAFTFWIVAIGVLILAIPVRILINMVRDLRK
jgi:hypothetical protein